uniref:Methyl-CpG-binding domain protein 6 n=1 Tax=Macrostomum lignano TaxID=282301 RepID=A0A1I8F9G9_9PLAT
MATASPVQQPPPRWLPAPTEALLSISTIKTIAANSTGSESRLKRIPKIFVPVANADSPANATGGSGEKFFTASVSSIDREFAPKPPFRLPPSWIPIDHTSGLTMYLHKPTKVVTLARPYFAGSVALRNHLIPHTSGLSALSRGVHTDCDMVDIVLPLSTDSPQSAAAAGRSRSSSQRKMALNLGKNN